MAENVAAATELAIFGKDQEALAGVEAILKPVKNQTWPSGIQRSWHFCFASICTLHLVRPSLPILLMGGLRRYYQSNPCLFIWESVLGWMQVSSSFLGIVLSSYEKRRFPHRIKWQAYQGICKKEELSGDNSPNQYCYMNTKPYSNSSTIWYCPGLFDCVSCCVSGELLQVECIGGLLWCVTVV